MKFYRLIKMFPVVFFASLFLVSCSSKSYSVSDTRVVVTGEDSNKNAVSRDSEIFTRVISQLQESLTRGGYYVIDEDMLKLKLGFSFNSGRPKSELIETLMVANETQDATVQSRLAAVFAIFPQVKELSFTKKLEIRIRGDVYDLQTFRPLATFEYQPKKAMVIPKSYKQCDSYCVEELIGKNAREIARELGDVLTKKLDIAIKKLGGNKSSVGNSETSSLATTYNLTVIRMSTSEALKFKKYLQKVSDVKSLKTLAVESSQRKMALESSADIGLIEEFLLEGLMEAGINIDNIRLLLSGTDIEIENLN